MGADHEAEQQDEHGHERDGRDQPVGLAPVRARLAAGHQQHAPEHRRHLGALPRGGDLAVAHLEQAGGERVDLGVPVRGDEDRRGRRRLAQGVEEQLGGRDVELGERLVEQDDRARLGVEACERCAAALARGHAFDRTVRIGVEAPAIERRRDASLAPATAAEVAEEPQVLARCEAVEQLRAMTQVEDVRRDVARSARERDQPRERAQGGRLARAVGAAQHGDPGSELEIDATEHGAVVEDDGRLAKGRERLRIRGGERSRARDRTLHDSMMRPGFLACAALVMVMAACQEPPATEPVARGRQVFRQQGCAECHRIDGSGGTLGPDLSHIATVAAGRRAGASPEEYIRESLDSPGAYVVPGYNDVMPRGLTRRLSAFEVDSLVRYLMTHR